ncbi:MAG TPA: serine hydrolase domain-containing protein [Acidimicrobiales bacterium]|nr:serine hydrolase domain-containing protein [Acidimicrobiales bacterium]
MAEVSGSCDPRFEQVRQAFESNFDQGLDVGASVAVFLDGEPVVDLWGGHLDLERTRPWREDTIINVWSTTKTMTAICALMLADRGEIDLHAPVARYWPEFAAAGKGGIEVRHLMSHTAGLSGWQEPLQVEDLYDWEKATGLLAAQEPWWEPGTMSGYHAVTQGYLVGEVIRRVTGRTVGRFFAEEVAGPLGADFFIGTPASADDRVAPVIPPEGLPTESDFEPGSIAVRTLSNPRLDGSESQTVPWRRAEIPAAGGHGNARSVAAVHSVIACGGEARGVRLMSPEGCEVIFEEQSNGPDAVLGVPIRFGMGFGLSGEMMPVGPHTYFWGGWGGSIIVVDLDTRMAVSYVMNRMESGLVGDLRGASIVLAAAASVAGD